jgi:hypothetical protein
MKGAATRLLTHFSVNVKDNIPSCKKKCLPKQIGDIMQNQR